VTRNNGIKSGGASTGEIQGSTLQGENLMSGIGLVEGIVFVSDDFL
jgi:hypothetical protein